MASSIPWYYAPVIFLGALMIILSFLVFLHWLVQFWLDNQERANDEDILDSGDSDYESEYGKKLTRDRNRIRRKRALKKTNDVYSKRGSNPAIEILKASSETSSVSSKGSKIKTKKRLAVNLSVKHDNVYKLLSGMIKGVIGLPLADHGGPNRIRFKMTLIPTKTKKVFKTPYHIPLDASLIIPFQFKIVLKEDLEKTVLHLRLFGKIDKFGLPFGPEHCYGEAYVSLADLLTTNEITIVQEVIPLGSKPFNRESLMIRVSSPKITTKQFDQQQTEVSPEEIKIYFNDGDKVSTSDDTEDKASKYAVEES
eukprot:Seg41.2 transcript_id=Seg41.2/GoldUCD/mRNA.D3Y31 product="hypothetical protein" protein_id=Seg41.2/GoldUCD/D3Y31